MDRHKRLQHVQRHLIIWRSCSMMERKESKVGREAVDSAAAAAAAAADAAAVEETAADTAHAAGAGEGVSSATTQDVAATFAAEAAVPSGEGFEDVTVDLDELAVQKGDSGKKICSAAILDASAPVAGDRVLRISNKDPASIDLEDEEEGEVDHRGPNVRCQRPSAVVRGRATFLVQMEADE